MARFVSQSNRILMRNCYLCAVYICTRSSNGQKLGRHTLRRNSVLCFSNGIAAYKGFVTCDTFEGMRSERWGYIDIHSNLIIPYRFNECGLLER